MNELKIFNQETQRISARELHKELDIQKRFSAWFESNSNGFIEGEDFTSVLKGTEVQNNGGIQVRDLQDYEVSIDMAKHICLMSKSENGKKVRQYLIDLEKAWNTPEQVMARALKIADTTIASLTKQVSELQPKADFYDAVTDSKDAIPMADVAKVLDFKNIGRNKLFNYLRNKKVLQEDNKPYQRYIDNGWFRTVESKYTDKVGNTHINITTLVYQKGVDGIRKMLVKDLEMIPAECNI